MHSHWLHYFTVDSPGTLFCTLKPVWGGKAPLLRKEFTLENGEEAIITVTALLRYNGLNHKTEDYIDENSRHLISGISDFVKLLVVEIEG